MELSLILISKLASMMLMVVVGFAVVRLGVMRVEDSRPISTMTVYVLTPCLIIRAFQIELTSLRLQGFIAAVLLTTGSYLLWILVCKLLKRPLKLTSIDEATLVYSNVGNLTLPLISMILGDEMVFYVGSMQLPFNLFIWTHGLLTIQGKGRIEWRRTFLNSNMVALYIGVVLLITQIRLPDVLDTTMSAFSSMVGPASMLVAGMVIAGSDLKKVFTYKKAYLIELGRLIILPVLSMLVLYATGLHRHHPQLVPILMAVMIGLAAPSASTVAQLAVVYNKDPEKASIYNVLGLLLCIVTIPLVVMLYQRLFGIA